MTKLLLFVVFLVGAVIADLNVYTDSLQSPFQDWSWVTTKNQQDSTEAHSGQYSFSFVPIAWGALYIDANQDIIDTTVYSGLRFWMYIPTGGDTDIEVDIIKGGSPVGPNNLLQTYLVAGGAVPFNTWFEAYVPFSQYAAGQYDGIWWQDKSGSPSAIAVYLDDVSLVTQPPSSSSSSAAATVASTAATVASTAATVASTAATVASTASSTTASSVTPDNTASTSATASTASTASASTAAATTASATTAAATTAAATTAAATTAAATTASASTSAASTAAAASATSTASATTATTGVATTPSVSSTGSSSTTGSTGIPTGTGPTDSTVLGFYQTGFSQTHATYYGAYASGGACSLDPTPQAGTDSSIWSTIAISNFQWLGSETCGMCLAVTYLGSGDGASPPPSKYHVFVNNLCPECVEGGTDIGQSGDGIWNISWVAIPCPTTTPIQYLFQGSNPYYIKVQARNTKYPVLQFAVQVGSSYQQLARTADNFFQAGSSFSGYPLQFPLSIQLTSINGEVVTDSIPSLVNSQVINGAAQFS